MPTNSLAGISLRDLEYALAVAEMRHFGQAAERCNVSQAGLSEGVRRLEALLGVALFERRFRSVLLTPEGEALLEGAQAVLDAARGLLALAQRRAEPLEGPLRIGVIATLGPYYLPSLLRDVRLSLPNLELRLEEGRTASLLEALRAGALDVVLLALPVAAAEVASVPIFFEPFLAALPVDHPLAGQPKLEIDQLAGDGLLLLEEGHCLRDQALSLCGVTPGENGSRLASSLEMLRHMIAASEGYSLLPLLAARVGTALDGLVVHRDIGGEGVGRVIGLAWRNADPRQGSFERLAEFLRTTAPEGTRALPAEGDRLAAEG